MRKLVMLICAMICLCFCAPGVRAAEDLSGKELVADHSGFSSLNRLFDGRTIESTKIKDGGHVTLKHEAGIGSIYLVLDREYGSITLTNQDDGTQKTVEETGFLHVFLDLEELFGYAPEAATLTFGSGEALLNELWAFGPGQVPDWVQQWMPPVEGAADLVLFSTHGDDEQLFFAGMLPYYSRELGYNVQVVYMTGHRNMSMRRSHEMLDGLWAVGVRHYPVFGSFGDYNSSSGAEAYQIYRNKGITREEILAFVVENVRRFHPKVAVGHDLQGEYGHGMHMVYAELLYEAVEISSDGSQFPESAERYGVWDVPKTYLHLYPESQIMMDWDVPLDSFGGMTAFEVTKELGFPCHISQQTYYSWYFAGKDTAEEITEYSPREFGLYRSTVGEDVLKNDFFENVTTHGEDALLEAKRQAEEEARLEAERIAEEAAGQTQPAGSGPEETEISPTQTGNAEPAEKSNAVYVWIAAAFGVVIWIMLSKKFRKNKNKNF